MERKLVRFAKSARKHRIGKAHVLHVLEKYEPTIVLAPETKDSHLLWTGMDERGLELEVVAVMLAEYLLVIHVMPRTFRRR
ncbi:MAG: hypothetical protein EBQ72_00005 [Actinobacteria bacterium]|nr:hypothetical protein [Actinomycetota bacterium]